MVTTGEIKGWKTVAPPEVVLKNWTPPEIIGVEDCAEIEAAAEKSNKRTDQNFRNIGSSRAAEFTDARAILGTRARNKQHGSTP